MFPSNRYKLLGNHEVRHHPGLTNYVMLRHRRTGGRWQCWRFDSSKLLHYYYYSSFTTPMIVLEVANAKDRNVSGCNWNDRKSLWCGNARCCRPNLRACNRACTQGVNREDAEGSPLWLLKFSRTLHDSYYGFASSGEGSAKDRDTTGCYWNDRKSLWCGNARCCKPNKRACNKVCV